MHQPRKNNVFTLFNILFVTIFLSFSLNAFAEAPRADHFKGLPANTLDEALINLKTYNKKLRAILAKEGVTREDLGEVHMLSYTLENALQKISQEISKTAEALESVHLGSETADKERVKLLGDYYLKQTATLFGTE